jgi:hypothetical protein
MPIEYEGLSQLGFEETEISFTVSHEEKSITYQYPTKCNDDQPGVYLFLDEVRSNTAEVLYVGKAGRGMGRRIRQHQAGFYRNKEKGIYSKAILRLFKYCHKQNAAELVVSVWFRKSHLSAVPEALGYKGNEQVFSDQISDRHKGRKVSRFSSEEEALIVLFNGDNLINTSIPLFFDEKTPQLHNNGGDIDSTIDKIAAKCKGHKDCNDLRERLRKISEEWDEHSKEAFIQGIESVARDDIYSQRVPKIIERYSKGPFRNEPLLVFGELREGCKKFTKHTNNLYFTLDGRHMVKYPFDKKLTEIINLADFLDF